MTRLGEITSARLAPGRWLLVPVGSCEQHGPHLPLDTDTRIAVAVCEAVAHREENALVAPTIAIGASGEHAGFPGTLSIGTEGLADAVIELVRSAEAFAGVLLVNAHGGNGTALEAAVARCRTEGRHTAVHHIGFPEGDAHAGRTETSILLVLAPDLVELDQAVPGEVTPIRDLMPRLRTEGVAGVSLTGVLGDPTGASAEEGRLLLESAIESATDALTLLRSGSGS